MLLSGTKVILSQAGQGWVARGNNQGLEAALECQPNQKLPPLHRVQITRRSDNIPLQEKLVRLHQALSLRIYQVDLLV